jgi:replicative DNA helicase
MADIVSFLYRPEYYKIDEWDDDEFLPLLVKQKS